MPLGSRGVWTPGGKKVEECWTQQQGLSCPLPPVGLEWTPAAFQRRNAREGTRVTHLEWALFSPDSLAVWASFSSKASFSSRNISKRSRPRICGREGVEEH